MPEYPPTVPSRSSAGVERAEIVMVEVHAFGVAADGDARLALRVFGRNSALRFDEEELWRGRDERVERRIQDEIDRSGVDVHGADTGSRTSTRGNPGSWPVRKIAPASARATSNQENARHSGSQQSSTCRREHRLLQGEAHACAIRASIARFCNLGYLWLRLWKSRAEADITSLAWPRNTHVTRCVLRRRRLSACPPGARTAPRSAA